VSLVGPPPLPRRGFFTAQICGRGHVITDAIERHPERFKKFCDKCGTDTFVCCPNCQATLRGRERQAGPVIVITNYIVPRFCEDCGHPLPWTEYAVSETAQIITAALKLSSDDRTRLMDELNGYVRRGEDDAPRIPMLKRLWTTLAPEVKDVVAGVLGNVLYGRLPGLLP